MEVFRLIDCKASEPLSSDIVNYLHNPNSKDFVKINDFPIEPQPGNVFICKRETFVLKSFDKLTWHSRGKRKVKHSYTYVEENYYLEKTCNSVLTLNTYIPDDNTIGFFNAVLLDKQRG